MLAKFYESKYPVTVDAKQTVAVDIDRIRFNRILEQVCQGLFFNEHAYNWQNEIEIHCPILLSILDNNSQTINSLVGKLSKAIIRKLGQNQKKGENPDIFWYQMLVEHAKKRMICRLMFYGGFEILAITDPFLRSTKCIA